MAVIAHAGFLHETNTFAPVKATWNDFVRAEGAASYGALAAGLNARGVPAPRGGRWHPASVRQVLRQAPATSPGATAARGS